SDLNLPGQIGQFVDGEDAAIGAGQQSVMDRQFVREQMPSARGLDRVDVAYDVRDGHVGRRQLFNVSGVGIDPGDRRVVAFFGYESFAVSADRAERIIINLRPGADRDLFVEQRRQCTQDAALGLAAQPKQDDVVPGQQRVDDLRNDGVFVTDYAAGDFSFVIFTRKKIVAAAKRFN